MILDPDELTPETLQRELDDIGRRLNLPRAEDALRFPKYFQIETVRLCNSRCPFCAVTQWDKSVPYMSDALYDKLVREMTPHAKWIEFVSIQRAGEPLLDKKLPERVRAMKAIGIKKVSVTSNASLLTEERAVALLEAGLDEMMLSIDSIDPEVYPTMRVGLDYDTVIRNIRTFFFVRDRLRPDALIRVRGVSYHDPDRAEDKERMACWEAFWDELRRPQDRIYLKRAHTWGNQRLWEGHPVDLGVTYHPCIIPWSTLQVTTSGKVPLCGNDYDADFGLGDTNVQTLEEIWHNAAWARIREMHAAGRRNELGICRGCRIWDLEMSLENWQQKQLQEG